MVRCNTHNIIICTYLGSIVIIHFLNVGHMDVAKLHTYDAVLVTTW